MTAPTPPVWTDDRIREAFIYDGGEAEYHDPISGAQTQRRVAGYIFDAWLAAHDAALREALSTPPADDVREALATNPKSGAPSADTYKPCRVFWSDGVWTPDGLGTCSTCGNDEEDHGTSTSPEDDVREALAEIERWKDRPTITRRSHMDQIEGIERLRDLLAAEVRPHGTVTDAKVSAVQDALSIPFHGLSFRDRAIVRAALEAAREVHP